MGAGSSGRGRAVDHELFELPVDAEPFQGASCPRVGALIQFFRRGRRADFEGWWGTNRPGDEDWGAWSSSVTTAIGPAP